jgi:hypothetical protein
LSTLAPKAILSGFSTGLPAWANFRLWGDCFLIGQLLKITEVALFLFNRKSYVFILTEIGLHFGRLFPNSSG